VVGATQAAGLLHPGLRELELNHCRVGKIGSLESAPALQRLELRDNGLTVIEGLEALSGLTSLDLQGNRIDKIGDTLALCSSLTYVDLSYNALSFKKPEVSLISNIHALPSHHAGMV
jgi:Leucine-rich repeat (LRR) protein